MENLFVKEMKMGAGSAYTDNGAISYASTGSVLVDQFAKSGAARLRDLNTVFNEQAALWNESPLNATIFPFYLRMITRKTNLFLNKTTEKVQKGQGCRDEAFKRLLWIAYCHPDVFYTNIWLLPIVGSWKDLWVLLDMDYTNGYLKKDIFFQLIAEGIKDEYHKDLVKKYLPRIRSTKKCTTNWANHTNRLAKEFIKYVGWTTKDYRHFKSNGKAHEFQQYICKGLYDKLNFNKIPGKALFNLIKGESNFITKHNLTDRFMKWLDTQDTVKFTGYVYELGKVCPTTNHYVKPLSLIQKRTIDKQFDGLIELAKKDNKGITGNVWCLLDTSGSMNCQVRGTNVTCSTIANSLAVYFSTLNEGAFHKCVLGFDDVSNFYQLKGTFTEMMSKLPRVGCGGTNFIGAIDEIIRVRKNNPNIPLEDYPKTLLAISDMQFNCYRGNVEGTNYEVMKNKLYEAFPKEFVDDMKFIWWHVTANYNDFPSTIDEPGCYFFSGFDGAIISLLLGVEEKKNENGETIKPTMEELINQAFSQEVLKYVTID